MKICDVSVIIFICISSIATTRSVADIAEIGIEVMADFDDKQAHDGSWSLHGEAWNFSRNAIIVKFIGGRQNASIFLRNDALEFRPLTPLEFDGRPPEWTELWPAASVKLRNSIVSSVSFEAKIGNTYGLTKQLLKAGKLFIELELLIEEDQEENRLRRVRVMIPIRTTFKYATPPPTHSQPTPAPPGP